MKIRHAPLAALALCLFANSLRADEKPLREILRDGLYAEEVSRDPAAAAKSYEDLLARYADERAFAASALFRLAEVRRKQDRKDDAIQLYQRLLTEFPQAENETKLARENLAAMGGKLPEVETPATDPESKELARLEALAKTSPDVVRDPETLFKSVQSGFPKVVAYLLSAGADPLTEDALMVAAEHGNLEIVKLLLEKGGQVPDKMSVKTLKYAISSKRNVVVAYLLDHGLKIATDLAENEGKTLLASALIQHNEAAAAILLKHGANIDEQADVGPSGDFRSGGTALHTCISAGEYAGAQWLFDHGAKPDLASPTFALTPLHLAIKGETPGTLEMIGALLDAGADPNHVSADRNGDGNFEKFNTFNATPLETAIVSDSMALEKVKLLLKHGGNPARKGSRADSMLQQCIQGNRADALELTGILGEAGLSMKDPSLMREAIGKGNTKLVAQVLKYGGDPNGVDEKGKSFLFRAFELKRIELAKVLLDGGADPRTKSPEGDPLLTWACSAGNVELVKMLLAAGADPKATMVNGSDMLQVAAYSGSKEAVECMKLLADAGARPDPKWADKRYAGAQREPLLFLLDRFILPDLAEKDAVSFVMDLGTGVEAVPIAEGKAPAKPPVLEKWLLAHGPKLNFAVESENFAKYDWRIWRKDPQGKPAATDLDLASSGPFPSLQWGDVVECRLVSMPAGNYNFSSGLPPAVNWSVRKRISFPITVEIDGKSREMTMRGDRVIFDPTKDELPLADVQTVVKLLWETTEFQMPEPGMIINGRPFKPEETSPSYIVISRVGWPDARLKYDSNEASKFPLESGDRIRAEFSNSFLKGKEWVRKFVLTVTAEGHPFARTYSTGQDLKTAQLQLPTLIQALVDVQVPAKSAWSKWSGTTTLGPAELMGADDIFSGFASLPFPDLSHIRIRRLLEDGKEKVIEVDLAKAISAMTPETTPEEARKEDMDLQVGDIVEIPLLPEAGKPWKGFGEEESRFFALALSGKVQMIDEKGNLTFAPIDWRPVRFLDTEAGWLPVPPEGGVPSPRAWSLIHDTNGTITRGGVTASDPSSVFLRDGDEFRAEVVSHQPVPPPAPQRQPRVVPPPQPGQGRNQPSLPDPIR